MEGQYIYENKLILPFIDLIHLLQILSLALTCVAEIRFMCFSPIPVCPVVINSSIMSLRKNTNEFEFKLIDIHRRVLVVSF